MHINESFVSFSPEALQQVLQEWERIQSDEDAVDEELRLHPEELQKAQKSYVQTLHPFLQKYYRHHYFHEPIDKEKLDALQTLRDYCGNESLIHQHETYGWIVPQKDKTRSAELKDSLSDWGKELLAEYQEDAVLIGRQSAIAVFQLDQLSQSYRSVIRQRLQNAYWAKRGNANLPYQAGYELARLGYSTGKSGFHDAMVSCGDLPSPFGFCGWAGDHSNYVGMCIEKRCFCGSDVQLYYFDDDNWPNFGDETALSLIRQYSSGLTDVHHEKRIVNVFGKMAERTLTVFSLSADAIRETVMLGSEEMPSAAIGGYLFVLPRCGEFRCELGEIKNGELIPLHRDDYCMK